MYAIRREWHNRRWHMLLERRQNIAPPEKAKNGHRGIGRTSIGAIILATSSFTADRTDMLVACVNLCGRQSEISCSRCQRDKDGSMSREPKDVFSSSFILCRSDR